MIPLLEPRQWSPRAGELLPLEIRHYGEKSGAWSVYDDDGETFDYEQGAYSWTQLSVQRDPASGTWVHKVTSSPGGRPWSYSEVQWRFMSGRR